MNAIVIFTGVAAAIIIIGFMVWAVVDYIKKKNIDIWEEVKERCKEEKK